MLGLDYPENVAEQEAPKTDLTLAFGLGSNEPCGDYRNNHCGPLELMEIVHSFA